MKNLYSVPEPGITSYPLSTILQTANSYQGKLIQIGMLEGNKRKMNMPCQWQQLRQLKSNARSNTKKTTLQAEERRRLFELKNGNIMKMPLCRQKNIDLKRANSEGKKTMKSKLERNPGSGLLSRHFQNKVEESEDAKLRKQMMRVERWLEECQKYQELWVGGEEGGHDDNIVITCPTWMKTAAETRRNRVSRRQCRGTNPEGGRDVVMDENFESSCNEATSGGIAEDQVTSPSFQHHSIQNHFDIISAPEKECETGQSISSLISQGRDNETRLVQRIEKTGADLSMIFQDGGNADEAIMITCCFERCENEYYQEPIGILTRRKARKYDCGSMDISSMDANSEFQIMKSLEISSG